MLARRVLGALAAVAGLLSAQVSDIARLYEQGRYEEARQAAAAAIAKAPLTTAPCSVAMLYQLQGVAENGLGLFTAAADTLERGIRMCERQSPPVASVMVPLLVGLAEAHSTTGRFADARSALQRALVLAEGEFAPGHPRLAAVLDGFGYLHIWQGEPARAEPYFRKSLAILAAALGESHPDLASRSLTIGSLLIAEGRLGEAVPLVERSRRVLIDARGPAHPDAVFASLTLAVSKLKSAPAEAERLLQDALAAWLSGQPELHRTTAKLWNALAVAQSAQRRHADAAASGARALAILRQAAGPEHPHTVTVMENQARFLAAARRKREAGELKAAASRIRRERGYAESSGHAVDIRALLAR